MDQRLHDLHLHAGKLAGREKTCGTKAAYDSEESATRAAAAHNRWAKRRHDVEPYPCAFCQQWHVGNIMPLALLKEMSAAAEPSVKGEQETAIAGLQYIRGFVTEPEEAALLAAVDAEPWLADLKRRVQHYGYRYDYAARKVDPSMYLGPLAAWAQPLAARLVEEKYMPAVPDQLIVNEYDPGQGISAHVDCVPCFGPVVCSLTLGSQCEMELTEVAGDGAAKLLLERGSLLVLTDEARYKWRHGIRGRKTDTVAGEAIPRCRRVSLTFRTVLLEA